MFPSCPRWNESLQANATRFPGTPAYIFDLPLLKEQQAWLKEYMSKGKEVQKARFSFYGKIVDAITL